MRSPVCAPVSTLASGWLVIDPCRGHQAFKHDLFGRDHSLVGLAGETVVTAGIGGVVTALDFGGGHLWTRKVGIHKDDDVSSFPGSLEVWPGRRGGIVGPMAVDRDFVYVATVSAPTVYPSEQTPGQGLLAALGTEPSFVMALRLENGDLEWESTSARP